MAQSVGLTEEKVLAALGLAKCVDTFKEVVEVILDPSYGESPEEAGQEVFLMLAAHCVVRE